LNVLFVANDSHWLEILLSTAEFTVERNHTNVMCDKAFSVFGTLTTHMRVHSRDKSYKCSLCDRSFSHLQRHKRHVHSNRRSSDCPYCGKLFKTNAELQSHVHVHTGSKPYSCRHCSERFTWRDQLKTHLLKSHMQ